MIAERTFTASLTQNEFDNQTDLTNIVYTKNSEGEYHKGDKTYELSNHLGNVLEVITDRVIPISADAVTTTSFEANVIAANDYYPFGMYMPGRHANAGSYRYGFQGQEKDDEIKGSGNSVNYKYRMHDARLGRFFAIDPMFVEYPYYSPYAFSGNRVIDAVELEGLQPGILFSTANAAALNFGSFYNDNSIRANQEYGSTIYQVPTASGIMFTYSIPNIGTTGSTVSCSPAPSGSTAVADIHTHAASTALAPPGSRFMDNIFSGSGTTTRPNTPAQNLASTTGDIGTPVAGNNSNGLIGYLATPNGSLQRYDPATGVITTLSSNMPSDPVDPGRLNTIPSTPSPTNYVIQSGDNLTQIAKRFDTTVTAIATENAIANVNDIKAGATLTITN